MPLTIFTNMYISVNLMLGAWTLPIVIPTCHYRCMVLDSVPLRLDMVETS